MGRQEMQANSCDMTMLAKRAFEQVDAEARSRVRHFDLKALPPAYGDRAMLRQVFFNIVSNAVKFTAHQAEPKLEIGGASTNGVNTYYVKDNGVGFDQRYADKLFGVFQRLHGEDEFEGTGVGLALVKRIIQRHHGNVWAEGRLNEGATFYFTLPAGRNTQ
jgi:light-regulated signal transduction histidine kinase (bacteriophytochrome)